MLPTYPAILRDNRLEWVGDMPSNLPPGQGVQVHVTLLDKVLVLAAAAQGQRMADALLKLADSQALQNINDSVAWERETRQDRALPDRDD